ncbi:MAG: hypothetical protein WAN65_16670 [Candidatus Sulfotelmatobacter sp.]
MADFTFVVSRELVLDGVPYNFSVYKSPAGFQTFWECKGCGNQEEPLTNLTTVEGAIAECEEVIKQHHARKSQPIHS